MSMRIKLKLLCLSWFMSVHSQSVSPCPLPDFTVIMLISLTSSLWYLRPILVHSSKWHHEQWTSQELWHLHKTNCDWLFYLQKLSGFLLNLIIATNSASCFLEFPDPRNLRLKIFPSIIHVINLLKWLLCLAEISNSLPSSCQILVQVEAAALLQIWVVVWKISR